MNLSKINIWAYRIAGGIIILFLLLGGAGLMMEGRYIIGATGAVCVVILLVLQFKAPSIKNWALMCGLTLFTMMTVGYLSHWNIK